jgi:6-methylsalicylate decarboxylase
MRDIELSRRTFLALCGAGTLAAAETGRGVIDVHHHLYPPAFVQALEKADQMTAAAKTWSPARSIEDMDAAGVTLAMTSITTPGVAFLGNKLAGDEEVARRLARECNDYAARLATDHKGRFGTFAILPWPNVDASLKEAEYALDTLKAEGIAMLTSYRDKWFGDAYFAPLFEELNRRKAVIYTHPTAANCCRNAMMPDIPDTAIEYGTDTSRAIARTIFGGASQKYPDIRFIFSHAGGTMPFLIERFTNLARTPPYAEKLPKGFAVEAAKMYYDTAQASNAAAMSALRRVAPMSQIVFGTDYPFRTSAEHVKGLKDCGVFSAGEIRAIERENPARLLRRV